MKARPALIAVGAAVVALSLAACGTNSAGGPSTPATVTDVTLSVWAPQEDQADATSWLPTQEAAFATAHPEYNITWSNAVVSEGDAGAQVQKDPSAAADVYLFANDQLGSLLQAHAIGVLPPASATQVKSQNSDVMLTSVTGSDGSLYGVPYTTNTWFMYYNKTMLTSDDVKSLDAMLAKTKVAFPIDNSWYLAAFYMGNGCTLYGDGTNESAGVDFTGQKAYDVTTYLTALVKNPNFVNDASGAGLAGVENGTIGAYFSGSWDAGAVKTALGDNMGTAQLPTFTVGGTAVQMKAFAGSKAAGFNPNAKNPTAAAQFAAFLGSSASQQDHYTMRGIIPSDQSLATDPAVAADPIAIAQMSVIGNTSVLQPTVAAMGNFWTPTESFGKALLSGDVTADNAQAKTDAWNTSLNS